MANEGFIPAVIIFVLSIAIMLPSEANIGIMIIHEFDNALCDENTADNVACKQIGFYIIMLRIIGFLMFVGDILYMRNQLKEGNWF